MKLRNAIMRSILGLIFVAVLFFGIGRQDVFAVQEDANLKTVRVGYLIYEGFQEGKGDEPKSGYGYEYLQQIAYYAGWKYEYVNGSFSELLQKLKDGGIDIMGSISALRCFVAQIYRERQNERRLVSFSRSHCI